MVGSKVALEENVAKAVTHQGSSTMTKLFWEGATVFGLSTDLNLKVAVNPHASPPAYPPARLNWATSIFYFGMGVLDLLP
jgi:hypothetical protein